MEPRKEMLPDRYDLPSRYWEPEPPEDYEDEITPEDEEMMEELPFE
jgi:hypothetical protein